MKKYKGTVTRSELWAKKPQWVIDEILENHPDFDDNRVVNDAYKDEIKQRITKLVMSMNAGDITALVRSMGFSYNVDWEK